MNRLEAMEAFARVLDAGSFSAAAKQLEIGQPAVSKSVALLEERLGVRLLMRSTHGVSPTEAGRSFYENAMGRSSETPRVAEDIALGVHGGAHGFECAHPRRGGNGQGAHRARHPPSPWPPDLRQAELRRDPTRASGERIGGNS